MGQSQRKPNGYWTKERCRQEALKYQTRTEFYSGSVTAYRMSSENGWLDEFCGHMQEPKKPNGYWTKEHCQEEALKYQTRSEFRAGNYGAYVSSSRGGWLSEVCSHMIRLVKPNGYWTKEQCKKEALKYQTRTEFRQKSPSAHRKASDNRWLKEICQHM